MRGVGLVLLGWLSIAWPAAAQAPFAPPAATERSVYRGAVLIDGTGAAPRPDMTVITRGDRIERVLPDSEVTPDLLADAEVIDLAGRFLLPGLIDSHQHLATPPRRLQAEGLMRRALYGGVTGMRIMADDLRSVAELDRAARTGEIEGPDLVHAAIMAGPSFFADPRTAAVSAGYRPGEAPWAQAVDEDTNLVRAVAMARGTGAAAIKIYANLPAALVRRIAEEAHRQGLRVWVHAMVFPALPSEVLDARPDVVSHTCYLAYEALDRRPSAYADRFPIDPEPFRSGDDPVMARLFATMRERGIVLDPTLRVYREVESRSTPERPPYCTLDLAARLTDQARRAGVTLSAGTDSYAPSDSPWPALHDELELLVARAGLTPMEAIVAATSVGAATIGQGDALGTIAPGRQADLVVLERDPTADIAHIRSVTMTVKRGRRFARADYRPITPEEAADDE
ncbi:amidohydrolase family protein [Sphingosinicella terrae]|uniref:amidohydrolase family protein n=1 Tax=Sphingosinicella terrae TaxID=2172047 RepID=UPI000E0CF440|nr:amidohydrolase family protein [Sphingosinicella terrae]